MKQAALWRAVHADLSRRDDLCGDCGTAGVRSGVTVSGGSFEVHGLGLLKFSFLFFFGDAAGTEVGGGRDVPPRRHSEQLHDRYKQRREKPRRAPHLKQKKCTLAHRNMFPVCVMKYAP